MAEGTYLYRTLPRRGPVAERSLWGVEQDSKRIQVSARPETLAKTESPYSAFLDDESALPEPVSHVSS